MSADDDYFRGLGPLPPTPTKERRIVGLHHIPTVHELLTPHVATFPDGTRVNLPVGTVLEEGQNEEAWTLEGRPFASLAALNPTR